LPNFTWINTPSDLSQLIDHLLTLNTLAVDTESDSLYSFFEKVCLLQLSTPTENFIVDPLAIDISPLGQVFSQSSVQKIFHAAEYDLITLHRDYGFVFENLFDTMLAARVLGWPRYGLGDILETHFKVQLNKKFQRYNWGRRPLSEAAVRYACLDTHYLHELRAEQVQALQEMGRLEEAQAAFNRMTHVRANVKVFDPADFWRIKGIRRLSESEQARVQALFVLRDRLAREMDRPPFKVLQNSTLIRLATSQPRNVKALHQIKGLSKGLASRYGKRILHTLGNPPGHPAAHPQHKRQNSRPVRNRYERLRQWRNHLADTRGVEADIIVSNDVLHALARENPQTLSELREADLLGPWQLDTYGEALLEELHA
jgi:ribonuclease D